MMEANNNNNHAQNESDNDEPILNLHIRVPPMPENPCGYPPFNMHLLPNYKGIKISPSDIPKLRYNSTVAQYNNWLADLRTAFNRDLAKYPTSHQKIILALITLDEQLKMTYNSATKASPILSQHWCK